MALEELLREEEDPELQEELEKKFILLDKELEELEEEIQL